MGGLLLTDRAHVWHLFVLQALGGAATAFYSPASSGLVPEVVERAKLQQANAMMGIARYLSFPLGAATGGAIVATIGPGTALLVDAGTYAISAALLFGMKLSPRARAASTPNFFAELREGWQAWTEHTWVWVLNVWIALYFLITYAPFFVLGPYIAKHDLGGAGAWGTVVTGEGIGALAGALVGLRIQPARPWVLVGAIFALTSVQSILLAAHVAGVGKQRERVRGKARDDLADHDPGDEDERDGDRAPVGRQPVVVMVVGHRREPSSASRSRAAGGAPRPRRPTRAGRPRPPTGTDRRTSRRRAPRATLRWCSPRDA